jgi:hypothetical protein
MKSTSSLAQTHQLFVGKEKMKSILSAVRLQSSINSGSKTIRLISRASESRKNKQRNFLRIR